MFPNTSIQVIDSGTYDLPENNNFLMSIYDRMDTHIAKFMGPTWDPPGSSRPQMAPCWPHEPCYQGNHPTIAKVEGAGVLDGKFCTILEYRLCALYMLPLWLYDTSNKMQLRLFMAHSSTVKPVCNDHLYNEINYMWFIIQ